LGPKDLPDDDIADFESFEDEPRHSFTWKHAHLTFFFGFFSPRSVISL
jgi:hypothetical protein